MTDHPRLTRYTPYVNGTAFMGMLRQNDTHPEMFGPSCDWTHGPYVLAAEADAEIERLRAEVERLRQYEPLPGGVPLREVLLQREVERLAQERSTVARNPYADQNRALVAEIATRRGITLGHLREDGGCELAQIMRRLDKAECMGEVAPSERLANLPKRAYYETREPPHCPTCGCGASEPNTPAPRS